MEFFDYEMMRVIWWVLLGVLLIGLAIFDGFDFGAAALLPVVSHTDEERRIVINTVGPVWEGNQVWLILGGGAIFAAWPPVYALSFSGFYLAMFLVLLALIIRPVGFKFRSKVENTKWRKTWDAGLVIGGLVPALIFGVAVGNVLLGVPYYFDQDLRIFYEGNLFGLLNPFGLFCGVLSVAMLCMHGATFIHLKTDGVVQERARNVGRLLAMVTAALFVLGGLIVAFMIDGYTVTSAVDNHGPSNPLGKTVEMETGSWLQNYSDYPVFILAPVLGLAGAVLTALLLARRAELASFITSAVAQFGIIATVGVSMFPFILPSSMDPQSSLTVWDASSSHLTLQIMLGCTVVFLPIVLAYTAWVYSIMAGKVTAKDLQTNKQSY